MIPNNFKKRKMDFYDDIEDIFNQETQCLEKNKINILVDVLNEAFNYQYVENELIFTTPIKKKHKIKESINTSSNYTNNNTLSLINKKYFILKDTGIKYPIEFKQIKNIEEKLYFLIKNTGNIIYDYDSSNIFEDFYIELYNFGINKIFTFQDFIDFNLHSLSYIDEDSNQRNILVNYYLPKYIKNDNILTSYEYKINIKIINKIGIGTFGTVFDCELYSLHNIKKYGNYVIKFVDIDSDEDIVIFFFEYLNQVILYNEFINNNLNNNIDIAKIPKIFYIGKIKNENKLFIVMEKINQTLYEKCRELTLTYIKNEKITSKKELKTFFTQNSVCLLNYIYQISNLIYSLNSIPYLKFIHNDLKLNNILFNNNNQCYLIDYGISNIKYKNYQIINSFPNKLNIKNNDFEPYGLNHFIFNNNIDSFHLIYNIYYTIFNFNIQKEYPNILFIKTIDDYFKLNLCNIIYNDNNLIVKKHEDIYLFKMNNEMFKNINNNIFFNIYNIKNYSKYMLNLLLNQ